MTTTLADQWRRLADRYRRVANSDCNEKDVAAANVQGGRLLYATKTAGFLSVELPAPPVCERPSDDDSAYMHSLWLGLCSMLPGNAPAIKWEHTPSNEHGTSIALGRMSNSDWRIRAENFADACEEMASLVGGCCDPPSVSSGRNRQKNGQEKKLPKNKEVTEAARHIRKRRRELAGGVGVAKSNKQLIAEYLKTDEDDSKVKSIARQLQPSRYGWLLDVDD